MISSRGVSLYPVADCCCCYCVRCVSLYAVSAGPVLTAILHHLGLIKYSSEQLSSARQQQQLEEQELPVGQEERALRAAAVAAVDAVVVAAAAAASGDAAAAGGGGVITARELSNYLLVQVREEEGSGKLMFEGAVLKPHVTRGTVAY